MATVPPEPPTDPSHPPAQHMANPRRLLILSPASQSLSTIPPLLHSLTGVPVSDPPQHQTPPETEPTTPPQSSASPLPPSTAAPTTTSFAGYTTHSPLRLRTKYYTAEVPVWVDEIPFSTATPQKKDDKTPTTGQWRAEFMSAEAEIVRDAVGALVVCVRSIEPDSNPSSASGAGKEIDPAERADVRAVRELMREVGTVRGCIDEERGGMGDVPGVFVLVGDRKATAPRAPETSHDLDGAGLGLGVDDGGLGGGVEDAPFSVAWWEDQLFDMGLFGWEVVEWDPHEQSGEATRNQFGEYEGMPRIKEVLETHDWTASGDTTLDQDPELDTDDEFDDFVGFDKSSHSRGFGEEVNELEREMMGLRMAIERGGDGYEDSDGDGNGDENEVESMEGLMMRVQAIRDMSSDLPESERRTFAAKAVKDILREL